MSCDGLTDLILIVDSDLPGSQHSEEEVEEEEIIDLSSIPFEQLTEEQKVQVRSSAYLRYVISKEKVHM